MINVDVFCSAEDQYVILEDGQSEAEEANEAAATTTVTQTIEATISEDGQITINT